MAPEWDIFATLRQIRAELSALNLKVDKIMTTDASVAASAAAIETQVAAENTAITSLNASFGTLLQEVQNGDASVSPATLAALQQAVADLTTATSGATSAATQEASELPAPPVSG